MALSDLFCPEVRSADQHDVFRREFDPSKDEHNALSKLGETCTQKVGQLVSKRFKSKSIGHIRKLVKLELEKELKEVDGLVRGILEIKE
ncbi:MAG: hypothetical protein ACE5IW_01470 [bacterium]